jgi:GNAT superfamily N-acetyltransferase
MGTLEIRMAKKGDEALIVAMLRELAEYEKLLDRFHVTPEIVLRDYLSPHPAVFCDLAFEGDAPAGIATWYWSYGSFAAMRRIFLADLFVRPEFRGKHYGRALLANLARRVRAHGGGGVDWEVLDWNKPSIDFYDSLGAMESKGWLTYNLSGEALNRLAKS